MALYLEQFQKHHDFPKQDAVWQDYIICYTPRSGSHLLGHTLKQTNVLGFPLEYFNPVNLPEWQKRFGTEGILDTYREIQRHRTSPNGCFGCKLSYRQFKKIMQRHKFEDFFSSNCKFIFVRRRDLIAQAVSLAKMWTTGSAISSVNPTQEPIYNRQLIEKACELIARENACWEILFARRRCQYIEVYYEDFAKDLNLTVSDVTSFLNIEIPRDFKVSASSLPEKQRDKINQIWKEKFFNEIDNSGYETEINWLEQKESAQREPSLREILGFLVKKTKRKLPFI
ncbi:hypothetical protein PCC7418_2773 [Halothece sp. PCC 7418]|uniref:Stf0 family sulfotransferase n=1 Tax=Halothece sp. (strain PCC 7418) TaxID=65093 RepID=UPI0002A07CE0|nr:Stf0 family sulfotransferase [Halothece sp. PCC 7418]AFZ44909.1 hypothetical protein PCC7418_2773 [Halothece sp. PCC 7418]